MHFYTKLNLPILCSVFGTQSLAMLPRPTLLSPLILFSATTVQIEYVINHRQLLTIFGKED